MSDALVTFAITSNSTGAGAAVVSTDADLLVAELVDFIDYKKLAAMLEECPQFKRYKTRTRSECGCVWIRFEKEDNQLAIGDVLIRQCDAHDLSRLKQKSEEYARER